MTTITRNADATYTMNENGHETILTPVEKPWGPELQLPENETGRKYLRVTKAFTNSDTIELKPITRTPSTEPRQTRQTSQFKKLYAALDLISQYIPQSLYDDINEQIRDDEEKFKAEHEKKPLTEKEKLEKKLAALQKKLNDLTEGD